MTERKYDASGILENIAEDDFKFRVGTSLLTEFAVGHTPADVLRELVQNEFDAGGSSLEVVFGEVALKVTGNGAIIDRKGWRRLSVMLGTGSVAGLGDAIQPKVNGIGSKNFGLRSLFLFGDRIHVCSGGSQTVLDRRAGALPSPRPHPISAGTTGVTVIVPYRLIPDDRLPPFDAEHENEALASIATELAPTLIKLALPSSPKSVRTVVVRSERQNGELTWHQSVHRLQGASKALTRRVRIDQSGAPFGEVPATISEREYPVTVMPPSELLGRSIPTYFRAAGGRVRLGVSFQMRGTRIDRSGVGIFYYPLGARRTRTGFPFSVSAPFEMNEDRSHVVDPANSDWNRWLIRELARFVVDLLRDELFRTFGASAYLALDPRGAASSTVGELAEEIEKHLRVEKCWPSQGRSGRKRLPVFSALGSLAVPTTKGVAECVPDLLKRENVMDAGLVGLSAAKDLAISLGSPCFTLSSLIRLRCAGNDTNSLETKLKPGEMARLYTAFPEPLKDLGLQTLFAKALDTDSSQLQDSHKADLRRSPTTLTAAGTLGRPDAPLWLVDETIAAVVPPADRLHPDLARFKVLPALCKQFNASAWAIRAAARIAAGTTTDEERHAVFRFLTGEPTLSERAWQALGKAPVLPDDHGEWTPPAQMVRRTTQGAKYLKAALHFPRPEDEANEKLARLPFRRSLIGDDLIELARLVEAGTVPPSTMIDALLGVPKLLTSKTSELLSRIAFLETSAGRLAAAVRAYVRNERTVSVLGDEAPYAIGLGARILDRLGCRSEPTVADIVARLTAQRANGLVPKRPALVYAALHDAARSEGRSPAEYRHQSILWTEMVWAAPDDCLVGPEHRAVFLEAVPVLTGTLSGIYVALGAHAKPQPVHWRRLFEWVSAQNPGDGPVSRRVAQALLRAYTRLDSLPGGLPVGTRCLLDDHGRLHAVDEAATEAFLINDDPMLADAIKSSGSSVSFADSSEPRALRLFHAVGVRLLSTVAKLGRTSIGDEVGSKEAPWAAAALRRAKESHFASALVALASSICGADNAPTPSRLSTRLRRLDRIVFAKHITRHYRIGRTTAPVPRRFEVEAGRIVLSPPKSRHDVRVLMARAVAAVADPSPQGDQRLSDPVFFLLQCRSIDEIKGELERRGIPWQPDPTIHWEEDESLDDEETIAVADAVSRAVVESALRPRTESALTRPTGGGAPSRPPRGPLPALELVKEKDVSAGDWTPPVGDRTGGAGGFSNWAPRSAQEQQDDGELGRRGEEIVVRRERERLAARGLSPDRVVWTADVDSAADHDIRSLDTDGEDLWIEVKSTTGRDGRFHWPRSEFQRALRERVRYVLCRVYEAQTLTPTVVEIRDPVGRFESGGLRLDLDSLAADVGPLAR